MRPSPTLSAEQWAAVTADDGPLRVIAGPGTGKTLVIVERIAHQIEARGVSPRTILVVTFSRKARQELQERLRTRLPEHGGRVLVTTYHALGRKIVLQWPETVGYRPGRLAVYTRPDVELVLREALAALGAALGDLSLDGLLAGLTRYRLGLDDQAGDAPVDLPALAAAYEERLRRRNAIDFTAMVTLPVRILEDAHPAGLAMLQAAYQQLLVDEFQDSSAGQYRLVQLLTARHRNLTVVGDVRQSIYRWRGSDPRLLLDFATVYPDARTVVLTTNYRSTGPIVAIGNGLMADHPPGHQLVAATPAGPPAVVRRCRDEVDEAGWVAGQIRRLRDSGQIAAWSEVAVIYRTHAQGQPLARALRAAGIPARARPSGVEALDSREAADAIAYLRLVDNPDDVLALSRVLNVPERGLQLLVDAVIEAVPASLAEVVALAERLDQALGKDGSTGLSARLHRLLVTLDGLRPHAAHISVGLLDSVLDASGYLAWLRGGRRATERLAALDGLRQLAQAAGPEDLGTWLAELQADDGPPGDGPEAVTLTSIHQAKGLEWAVVFVVGLEDGVLPDGRALADPVQVAEEECVAYVAVSRPRHYLFLSHCRQRTGRDGARRQQQPSRFLARLPPAAVAAG